MYRTSHLASATTRTLTQSHVDTSYAPKEWSVRLGREHPPAPSRTDILLDLRPSCGTMRILGMGVGWGSGVSAELI